MTPFRVLPQVQLPPASLSCGINQGGQLSSAISLDILADNSPSTAANAGREVIFQSPAVLLFSC